VSDNLLRRTLVALVDAEVEFVVCGGVACILQGVARATHDLDVRVALDTPNLQRFIAVSRQLGLSPRIPEPPEALLDAERRRQWVEEKQAVVFTLVSATGAFSVDVFLRYPIPMAELMAKADRFPIDGRTVAVSSKQHLIDAKRAIQPPRKQDLRDIEDLLELLDA
jgi:hypothetical protein